MAAKTPVSDDLKSSKSTPQSPKSKGKGKQVVAALAKATQAQNDEATSSSEDEGKDEVEPVEDEEDQMLVDGATTKRSSCTLL